MKVDPDINNEGDHGLRIKIAELERRLMEENDRYNQLESQSELAKLVANQEVEKYRRDCLSLRETASRLEEDLHTLRERNLKDQETLHGLVEEIDAKEREITEKIVELTVENRDLERGKKRYFDEVNEWRTRCAELEGRLSKLVGETAVEFERKERELREKFVEIVKRNQELEEKVLRLYEENSRLMGEGNASKAAKGKENGELEARILKLVEEKFQLVQKEKGVERQIDEEMPNRSVKLLQKEYNLMLTPESRKKRVRIAYDSQVPPGSADYAPKVADENVLAYSKNAYLKNAYHKRNVADQTSQRLYTGRIASSKQLAHALKKAETLQCNLKSCKPSFIKPMVRSQVSGGFWLGLPRKFCEKNLPTHDLVMILEDEREVEHKVKYLGGKTGLSGGWRGFALDHTLEIGDALLFELTEPTRFKVYIVKAIQDKSSKKIAGGHTNYSNNNKRRVMDMKNRR